MNFDLTNICEVYVKNHPPEPPTGKAENFNFSFTESQVVELLSKFLSEHCTIANVQSSVFDASYVECTLVIPASSFVPIHKPIIPFKSKSKPKTKKKAIKPKKTKKRKSKVKDVSRFRGFLKDE